MIKQRIYALNKITGREEPIYDIEAAPTTFNLMPEIPIFI